ncbi:hypothetical protein ERO13_A13G207550v2 [Gossypium hirsutum]|uniref:Uncharacterized protein n=6 Tax=Gossypium TaxID=3633 RepID=A0A2P5XMP0_GOSBA|nr:uncharacterized protein LOC108482330 [Gossypium arboreum]XP_040941670.1 uncharacterized protein LOC121202898 isoform X2 [Gossypium hirsutum]KAB2050168.1 hypothetical protein ES319_A13G227400v1 [Gossypium barbadense]TYG87802.1 hypothetical protein ES288_A13G244100v1 [Gossypium darwinii]TYH93369.1 hypothetical protein ES332_A13G249100v1 [Gossypium tomentosum]TYJ02595.1 hypothetical protein E1A91_A13G240300v1 [Gossypium mustelinum]KAG4167618.1 hypothetical protein ERO13_A13G207550v2 [Gossypiu
MEKSKRVSLGVQKNTKQSKKKKLLTNVFNYLKSDNYMFAPLISPSISAGPKLKEPIKGNKKKVLKMVDKYMKYDTYMYAPLLSSQLLGSLSSEQIQCISKVTVEVATTKTKLNTESANALAEEEQPHEDTRPTDNQTIAQGETVKHMVYHHRCSTPMSGKAMADHMKVRKLAVE